MPNKNEPLLLEIGTEEMPPQAQQHLSMALANTLSIAFEQAGLEPGNQQVFATPRRLAVFFESIATRQEDQTITRKGPSVKAAFDQKGKPTAACVGFAASCGAAVNKLSTLKTDQGEWLYFEQHQKGQTASTLIPLLIEEALKNLPIAKPMRWADQPISFVRPIHWIMLLLGKQTLQTPILGIKPDNRTFGHRYHAPESLTLKKPADYEQILFKKGWVIANFDKRKSKIREQLNKKSRHALITDTLLDEVAGLVEWPIVYQGTFDKRFLNIPKEVLIRAMEKHQRCFAIENNKHDIVNRFLIVSNINSKKPNLVISGNERVMRARLSDAEFFYQEDAKRTLNYFLERQKSVIFHRELGSLYEKTQRIAKLAYAIARLLDKNFTQALRAGELAKADLLSDMVNEFPSLQGTMGYYYALAHKEPQAVAQAIREHYLPCFSGDNLPKTDLGQILALADKLDTLVGMFGINQPPTGVKDPFALRRATLGILRILIEKNHALDLPTLIKLSSENFPDLPNKTVEADVLAFCLDRLKSWYQEHDINNQFFAAVMVNPLVCPLDLHHRITALHLFYKHSDAEALCAAHKRVKNILHKNSVIQNKPVIDKSLLKESAEKTLVTSILSTKKTIEPLIRKAKYQQALSLLSKLKPVVDAFFDHTLVNSDDSQLKTNRLNLLLSLNNLLTSVADLSVISE